MANNFFSNNDANFYWFFGVVEDRDDPERLGRLRLRILGYHTDDKEQLPTEDLPWAMPIQPAISAGTSGIGWSPTGPVEGTWCWGFFMDGEEGQLPAYVGTIAAVPQGGDGAGGDGTGNSPGAGGSGGAGSGKVDPALMEQLKNCNCTIAAKRKIASANKGTINTIIETCKSSGWTDPHAIAAILASAGVEAGWTVTDEKTRWPADFMMKNFSKVRSKGRAFADQLYAAGGIACANVAYGGRLDNENCDVVTTTQKDGYRYRGRGFVQITGKSNYRMLSKGMGLGDELVKNPDKVNSSIEFNTKCCLKYYEINRKIRPSSLNSDQAITTIVNATGNDTSTGNHQQKIELFKCFMENYTKNGKFI